MSQEREKKRHIQTSKKTTAGSDATSKKTKKPFVKPAITKVEHLPEVTTGFFGSLNP